MKSGLFLRKISLLQLICEKIFLHQTFYPDCLRRGLFQYLIFHKQPDIHIHFIIQQLLCEYYDSKICSDEIMDAYMIILFSQLLRMYQKHPLAEPNDSNNNEMLLLILRYIESNYLTATLNSVADIFGFHPNYLSSYVKKHTGKSFKELLITQRMIQAGFFLKNTNMPVLEIIREIGYENQGFFYKKFQEYYHMSPIEYRNS